MEAPGPGRRILYRLRGQLGLELDLDRGGVSQGEEDKLGCDKIRDEINLQM